MSEVKHSSGRMCPASWGLLAQDLRMRLERMREQPRLPKLEEDEPE